MIGALIGAGASLLGGALARRSARADARRAEERADPAAIRERYEAAGFNPLRGLGEASANPGLSSYQLSNDILMNSLASAGDGFGEAAVLRMQNTEQERQKERLENLVREATLGASVGGIYDAVSNRSADGGGSGSASPVPAGGYRGHVDNASGPVTDNGRGATGYRDEDGGLYSNDPDHLNPNALPQLTFGGGTVSGSGNFSGGQTFEDAMGDGIILNEAYSGLLAVDMFHEGRDIYERTGNRERIALGLDPWEDLPVPAYRDRFAGLPPAGHATFDAWGGPEVISQIEDAYERRGDSRYSYGDFNSYSPGQAIRGQSVHDWP